MGARMYATYDWFSGSVTRVHESTKSWAVTGRPTGDWNVTPVLRWKVQVCPSADSHFSAMSGSVASTPSS